VKKNCDGSFLSPRSQPTTAAAGTLNRRARAASSPAIKQARSTVFRYVTRVPTPAFQTPPKSVVFRRTAGHPDARSPRVTAAVSFSFAFALPKTLSRRTLRPVLTPALDLVIGVDAEDGIAVTYGLGISQEGVRPTRSAGEMPNILRRSPLVDQYRGMLSDPIVV
jgi:hypothetical protein